MTVQAHDSCVWPVADEAATARLAASFAHSALPLLQTAPHGLSLHLTGGLGAGKTTFVRHLLRSLGVAGRIKSPTYGLAESYELSSTFTAWHFDFYRLEDAQEFADAGLAELWAQPALRLVEWPEHAAPLLPAPELALELAMQAQHPTARHIEVKAQSALGMQWLAAILAYSASHPHP